MKKCSLGWLAVDMIGGHDSSELARWSWQFGVGQFRVGQATEVSFSLTLQVLLTEVF